MGEAVYLGESAGQFFSGKGGKLANTLKKPLEAVLQRGTHAQFFFFFGKVTLQLRVVIDEIKVSGEMVRVCAVLVRVCGGGLFENSV